MDLFASMRELRLGHHHPLSSPYEKCLCFVLLAFFTFFFQSVVHAAQETPVPQSLFDYSLEELLQVKITTASRSEEAAIDAPAKVKIITRQQIRERGYINLFDLLRDQVGVDSQAYSHETTYNHVAIRGVVGNNRFLIQQDGVRINSPAGDPIAVADNFPLFNAERVEIVYGPASALYGADAFTGVINIVTESENTDQSALGVYIGENDYRYFYGKTQVQLFDNVRLSLAGHFHEADNSDLSNHYPDVFALDDLVRFDGSVAVPAAQRSSYDAGTDSHSISTRLQLGEDFIIGFHQSLFESPTTTGLEPNTVDYGANASWSSRVGTIYGIYDVDINDETSVRIQGSHHYYEVDQASKFNNLFSNFQDGFKYAEADKTQLEAQVSFAWDENNKVIVGGNAEKISALPKTADLPIPYDPDRTSSEQNLFYGGTNDSLPIRFFETDYTNFGAFFHYRNSWIENLDGFFGIRYDNNSRYGETINPRAGFIYRPRSDITLKLLYGEAFLSPAPEFTFEHFGAFSGTTDENGLYTSNFVFIPNEDLKPEKLRSLEANLSYVPSANLVFDLSIYYSEIDNFIINTATAEPVSDFVPGGNIAFTSHNDNVGKLKVAGADFEVSYQKSFADSVLKLWGNYSFVDGQFQDKVRNIDADLPFTSKNKVKLGITYRYHAKYYLSANVHWIDDASTDTPNIVVGSDKARESSSYTVVGLNAGIDDLFPGLSVNLRVENLLNRKYYNAGTGVSITFAESPQNPRLVTVGLKYEF